MSLSLVLQRIRLIDEHVQTTVTVQHHDRANGLVSANRGYADEKIRAQDLQEPNDHVAADEVQDQVDGDLGIGTVGPGTIALPSASSPTPNPFTSGPRDSTAPATSHPTMKGQPPKFLCTEGRSGLPIDGVDSRSLDPNPNLSRPVDRGRHVPSCRTSGPPISQPTYPTHVRRRVFRALPLASSFMGSPGFPDAYSLRDSKTVG